MAIYKQSSNPIETSIYTSPIGLIRVRVSNDMVTEIEFTDNSHLYPVTQPSAGTLMFTVLRQLDEYFTGKRTTFDLPLAYEGTSFQINCWNFLNSIRYAETRSYSDEAIGVGNPKAVRAVAYANHNNRISIVIPCHRVIGKDGTLTGYGGGLWRKKWLLEHEMKVATSSLAAE